MSAQQITDKLLGHNRFIRYTDCMLEPDRLMCAFSPDVVQMKEPRLWKKNPADGPHCSSHVTGQCQHGSMSAGLQAYSTMSLTACQRAALARLVISSVRSLKMPLI